MYRLAMGIVGQGGGGEAICAIEASSSFMVLRKLWSLDIMFVDSF